MQFYWNYQLQCLTEINFIECGIRLSYLHMLAGHDIATDTIENAH